MVAIFVFRGDANHKLADRKAAAIVKAIRANAAQPLFVNLIEQGFEEFLGVDGQRYPIDEMTLELLGVQE